MILPEKHRVAAVLGHVEESWDKVTRVHEPNPERGTLPLPFRYTVPSVADAFQEMYHWDTYFTNLGLLRSGRVELAKSNVDNYLWMVDEFGYAPNGNLTRLLHRSQPPYLTQMVRDIHEETGDLPWLRGALRTLLAEYDFWMERRSTPTGLNRHFHDDDEEGARRFCEEIYTGRLHRPIPDHPFAQKLAGDHCYAEAETGWDFNPRFDRRCADFLPVDLNSLLYQAERNLAHFHRELDLDEAHFLDHAAESRKVLVSDFLWDDEEGFFYDFDYTRGERSRVRAGSALHPLYSGVATPEQARRLVANISKLEAGHGILTCEKTESGIVYQWDWPNGWPPVQGYSMMGLLNAGFPDDAERIAQKYIRLCVENFERTGKLWEKCNVVDGTTRVNDEHPMPPMVGWTAGVFLLACEIAGA